MFVQMLRVEEASKSKLSVDLQILRKRFERKEAALRDAQAGFDARLSAALAEERERITLGAGIAEAAKQMARDGNGGGSNTTSHAASPKSATKPPLERQHSLPGRGMGGFLRGGGTGSQTAVANTADRTLRGGGGTS